MVVVVMMLTLMLDAGLTLRPYRQLYLRAVRRRPSASLGGSLPLSARWVIYARLEFAIFRRPLVDGSVLGSQLAM